MDGCIFCKIVAGELPADVVFEDEQVIAFNDIAPVAPIHIVAITKAHFPTVADVAEVAPELTAHLLQTMTQLGESKAEAGFRIVFNTGEDAGQSVHHVHGHVLAGRSLQWPPG